MSHVADERRSWPDEAEGDRLVVDLRKQIESLKARIGERRAQMEAVGLTAAVQRQDEQPEG